MTHDFKHVTTDADVETFESSGTVFQGLLKEIRELSKKKPDATMSVSKVNLVNRVLDDLLAILGQEPEGKYLGLLDNDTLPQMSDAVLTMVQFESALDSFRSRYRKYVYGDFHWITAEFLEGWNEGDEES